MPIPPERPSVSVILAVLDEAEFIDGVISDLLAQDYDGPMQVIVADGRSDRRHRRRSWRSGRTGTSRLAVIPNPERRQAYGLNLAAEKASGEILVRADGHTRFAADYVRASVNVLEETGGAVGGRMFPVGRSPIRTGGGGRDEEPTHDGARAVPPFRSPGKRWTRCIWGRCAESSSRL